MAKEVFKMKKVNDYKKSAVFSCIAIVLFGISMVTGLIPGLVYSIDKITMYLGFSSLGLGLIYFRRYKTNNCYEGK